MADRTRGRWLLRLGVSAAVLVGIALLVDLETFARTLARIPVEIFALSFGINLVGSIVVPALQTRIALGVTRLRMSVADLVGINLMVRFYLMVLPRPAAVGLRWWAYRKGGEEDPGSDAAALMVFERLVQATVLLGALVLILGFERDALPAAADALWIVAFPLFFAALAGLASFLWAPAATLPRRLLRGPRVPESVRTRASRLLTAVEAYPELPVGRVALILALSLVHFVLFVLSFLVLLPPLGVELGFAPVAWIRIMVFVLTLVPITIAGIGVREAGLVGLLQLYGVSREAAFAAALAALAVQLLIGLIGAGVALWRQWRGGAPRRDVRIGPSRPAPD